MFLLEEKEPESFEARNEKNKDAELAEFRGGFWEIWESETKDLAQLPF